MTDKENWLRTVEFRNPEWIPCEFRLLPVVWHKYREKLEELVLRHPLIFRDYRRGSIDFDEFPPRYREGEYFRDSWGCVWHCIQGGMAGQVVGHPLADWKALDTYKMPDPLLQGEYEKRDWGKIKKEIEDCKRKGLLAKGAGEELFTRLYYLRGFENLMIDFAADAPQLPRLIEMLLDYEMRLVDKWLEMGVDVISFHTDIGAQNSLMISPVKFRKYIKPMFKKIFTRCRGAGVHVYLSSDGCLLDIIDDLIECGVSVHDPQIRANTLDGIASAYKGKMCINLDLDRQMFPFCKPEDIRRQVKEVVDKLALPQGGLMVWGVIGGDDVPLENIEALCEAMEKYCLKKKS
jgi:uroporphyrinogen decarboxylase